MDKILIIARVFPPRTGGIENFIYSIYSNINVSLTIVTPYKTGCREFDKNQKLNIQRSFKLPSKLNKQKIPLVPMFFTALRLIFTNKFKQVHCEQVQSGMIGYLLKKLFGIPYIVYAYGMEITGGGSKWLKTLVFQNASIIVSISDMTNKALIQEFDIDVNKIRLVHPGVDPEVFKPNLNATQIKKRFGLINKKVILTVGRLSAEEAYKGQDTVIKAMPKLLQEIPEAVYVIAGSGDDSKRLEKLSKDLHIENSIIFTDYIDTNELPLLYNSCDIFIMVSREKAEESGSGKKVEGYGIVFLEAGACGKPVIAGKSGGIEDAVQDSITGILVNPNSIDEISSTLMKLLKSPQEAQRLGKNGRSLVETDRNNILVGEKVLKITRELKK